MKLRIIANCFLVFSQINMIAQCAMCKAGAEQSLERGATDASWMNNGILFLMIIPFILIASLYWMYRQNREAE